jgi:hypothetical protein
MALTRPNYNNLNSNVEVFNDPITLLNGGAVSDDDVGILINRANGLIPNVALYFNETTQSFVTAYTYDDGMINANINVVNYAPITVGAVYTTNGLFWQGNGQPFVSASYGDANVLALLSGDITVGGNLTVVNTEIVKSIEVVAGNLVANSGTVSTSTTTGALVVDGGVGVSGNVYAGNVTATGYYNADGSPFVSGNAYVTSNVNVITQGAALEFIADYSDVKYPSGKFTLFQLGPVTFTLADQWASMSTTKNAYLDYTTNTVNTQNITLTLTLANAAFSVQSTDSITIGSDVITGTNLTGLGITGAGGTYTIPSSYFSSGYQTQNSVTLSANLSTSRGYEVAAGATLTNVPPTPFNVTAFNASYPTSSVPYFNITQTLTWSAVVTGTAASGTVVFSYNSNSVAIASLTTTGGTSGTVPTLDSTLVYKLTSNDYAGSGFNGAGSRTIPSTVTKVVNAATIYHPIFYKITGSSTNPTFTTSDSYLPYDYAVGQSVTTTSNTADWLWIGIPGTGNHTFHFIFLGSTVITTPDATFTGQTIDGYFYNYYGFTNYNAATAIIVDL